MAFVLSSVSGNLISAASAGYAPTNSGDVSAIASAYQIVSATATQLYAGAAYVTSVNNAPLSASRAGNAANASLANSAWYDGTGRFISSLPDSATVSAIASAYTTGKQDTLAFAYNTADQISSINGSALGGMDEAAVSGIASAYAESAASGCIPTSMSSDFQPVTGMSSYALSADVSATVDLVGTQSANWGGSALALSAGPSVTFTKSGNVLVAGLDETVLWSSNVTNGETSATLSGSIFDFESFRIFYRAGERYGSWLSTELMNRDLSGNSLQLTDWFINASDYMIVAAGLYTVSNDGLTLSGTHLKHMWFDPSNFGYAGQGTAGVRIYKVVGINRTAGV